MSEHEQNFGKQPNILITGTPGTGKSLLCKRLARKLKFNWIDCSKVAKENDFVTEYDKELECPILDEDKLLDHLEPIMQQGGNILEYHSCDLFPERWFQAVFVVTCSNTILFDRLKLRGYNEKKLKNNLECEIFGTIYEEAQNSYKTDIVFKLNGDTKQDMQTSIKTVSSWLKKCREK